MNQDPYESPRGLEMAGYSRVLRVRLGAGLVFVLSLVMGMLATRYYVDRSVGHMPREEAYEALPRDMRSIELTLFGWFLAFLGSLALSSAAVVVVAYSWKTAPPRDSPSDP